MAYRIVFSPEADEHLATLDAHRRTKLLDAIARRLASQPTLETRNRKLLRPNPVAQFRLRVGELRAYYDVQETPEQLVVIKAIGVKVQARLYVGGEVIDL